ncbi:MAG: phage tail tape measure protein [Acinetobacter sp.]|nr:phage tail tape measure protein [Acinetobacter sp.]MDN5713223.1 phage tail tape measure protein [Acinetobacter sp.]
MSKNSVVSLTLQVKGQQASQELKRIATEQVTAVQRINTEQQKLAPIQASQINNAKKISDELRKQGQAFTTQKREVLALDTARKLGIRTEQQINAEIKKTQGAYTQLGILQRQGLVTSKDMERAYASMKSRVAALNTELGKTVSTEKQIQQIQKTGGSGGMSTLQRGGAVAGAVTGGYYAARNVAASPLDHGRNFAASIFDATTSITGGFKGMTNEQAKAANQQLMGYAKDAVRQGHGTVEGISEAAQILSASGNYETVADLQKPLIAIARSSFASNASEADMAKLAGQAKQFGVAPDRTQAALDRMMGSGIAGGFELRDMAQFLPALLGVAKQAGFSGEQGLNAVTTHLQLARKYTGTPGEASTNIEDLYGLTGQKHFKDAIAKNIAVEAGDPTRAGKKKGSREFDLTQYLVNDSLKGIDTTTSIANLMNRQLSKNNEYNNLTAKLNQAIESKDEAQAENLRKAIELVITGEFGDIFHNKQSLSGISSIVTGMKNGDYQDIYNQSWGAEGSVDRISDIKGDNEFAQAAARQQETILAQIKIYDTVSDKLGDFQGELVSIMQGNQGLTAATLAATGALMVLAGVAGGGALGGVLTGGKSDGSLPQTKKMGGRGSGKLIKGAGAALVAPMAYDAGYSVGTEISERFVEGTAFGDLLGESIAKTLAFLGDEDAKAAVKDAEKYEKMIAEQQTSNQYNKELIGNIKTLINVTQQNKPIPFSASGLLGDITNHAAAEEKRHGAPPPYMMVNK